jgi:hypothetical protein
MYFTFFFIFSYCLLSFEAKAFVISDDRGKIDLEVPQNWKYKKNLLGLPHVFISSTDKQKTSLSVTMTGIVGVKLPHKELAKNQNDYQDGRKNWAKERHFRITQFYPYVVKLNSEKIKIHEIGLEYKKRDKEYTEISYFAECPKSFIHMKALGEKNSAGTLIAKKIPESLKCLE